MSHNVNHFQNHDLEILWCCCFVVAAKSWSKEVVKCYGPNRGTSGWSGFDEWIHEGTATFFICLVWWSHTLRCIAIRWMDYLSSCTIWAVRTYESSWSAERKRLSNWIYSISSKFVIYFHDTPSHSIECIMLRPKSQTQFCLANCNIQIQIVFQSIACSMLMPNPNPRYTCSRKEKLYPLSHFQNSHSKLKDIPFRSSVHRRGRRSEIQISNRAPILSTNSNR